MSGEGFQTSFVIDQPSREILLEGLDQIDLTLRETPRIAAFRQSDRSERPWAYLRPAASPQTQA